MLSGGAFSRSANLTLDQIENFRIKRLARRAARASAAQSPEPADDSPHTSDEDGSQKTENTE